MDIDLKQKNEQKDGRIAEMVLGKAISCLQKIGLPNEQLHNIKISADSKDLKYNMEFVASVISLGLGERYKNEIGNIDNANIIIDKAKNILNEYIMTQMSDYAKSIK